MSGSRVALEMARSAGSARPLPTSYADVDRVTGRLWTIVALAFGVRVAAALAWPSEVISDAQVYERQAWRIAQGLGYTTETGMPTAFYPPLYSYALAAIYAVVGRARFLAQVVQAGAGALVCVAVYTIARAIGRRTDVALVAALLVALDFPLTLYPRVFLSENLFTPLVALAMIAWMRAWQRDGLGAWAVFGVAMGLATLTRPVLNGLPLVALAVWPWAPSHAGRVRLDGAKVRRWITVGVVVMAAYVLTLAPWWMRNATVFGHRTVEITSSTGTGLYLSYFPVDGRRFGMPDPNEPLWAEGLRLKSQGTLSAEWDRSAYLRRETSAHLRQHPSLVLTLIPVKLGHLAWPFDWALFEGTGRLDASYVFILPFLVLGLWAVVRHARVRAAAPVLLLLAYTVVMTIAFLGAPRYRAPIQPYLHVFAAFGLVAWVGTRPWLVPWLAAWAAVLVALAVVIRR